MKSEIHLLESEYEKLQALQPVDPSFAPFLSEALSKSICMTMDDDDEDNNQLQLFANEVPDDKMSTSMCIDTGLEDSGDHNITTTAESSDSECKQMQSDDASHSTSGNEEFADANSFASW